MVSYTTQDVSNDSYQNIYLIQVVLIRVSINYLRLYTFFARLIVYLSTQS